MKKFAFALLVLLSLGFAAQAGPEAYSGKEVKQVVPPPCPEWYRDTEWNVSVWGTHVFTAEDWESDEYIESDHAWGGGIDLKYFFHRYFGVGIEGWAVDAHREAFDGITLSGTDVFTSNDRLVGVVKGTVTLRFPIHCSRFAPYIYGGAGAIFGGGEHLSFLVQSSRPGFFLDARYSDAETEFLGQIGAGFEVRITPHIGLINDFSWNFVARDNSDFGMIRGGVNFAF
jgi:hypothetical protein